MLRDGVVPSLLVLALCPGAAAAVEPTISIEPQAIVASGLTPGGQVVWFGVARQIAERTATLVRRERIATDDDKDGSVRLELGQPVPFQSIWVTVDLATGAAAVAVPEGYPLRQVDLPGRDLHAGGGKPDWVEDDRGYVEILLVRPGEGAWVATVGDGGAEDDDGAYDGRLVASLAHLHGVGASPAGGPQRFSPRDLVVVIDPNRMEVGLRQLVEAPQ
jgi:hypothetical protein